ncbi:TPA: hypothetical protein ACH3X1_014639 [Trebouxia sp. C0004]
MHCRQWWPAAESGKTQRTIDASQQASCTATNIACAPQHFSATQGQETAQVQMKQPGSDLAGPVSTEQKGLLKRQSAQHSDESLDWQTELLQTLLPKCNISAVQQQSTASRQGDSIACKNARLAPDLHSQMLLSKAPRSSNPPLLYAGIFLDPLSTARLLSFVCPKHSKLTADHLTMLYRPSQELLRSLTLGLVVDLQVLGKIEDSTLQAVAVRCPGWVMKFLQRPAHVTVSMAEGVKPKTAGDLLQKVQQGHIYGVEYRRCTEDITLTGRVGVKLSNGIIAYSAQQVTAGFAAPIPASVSSSFSSSAGRPSPEQAAKPFGDGQTCHLPLPSHSQSQAQVGILSRLSRPINRAAPQRLLPDADISPDQLYRLQTEPVSQPVMSSVPYVQYEDQDEDDALDALQELDALLMPASFTRCKAPSVSSPSSVLRDTMKYQHTPTARRSAAGTHTSTTNREEMCSPLQTPAASDTSASYNAARGLWTADRDEQHSASKSAHSLWTAGRDQQAQTKRSSPVPVRILKRPNIATGHCSLDAISPPMAGPSSQSLSRSGSTSRRFAAHPTAPSTLLSDIPCTLLSTVSTADPGTAAASADAPVQSSSTSLINERLKSQSVLNILQCQPQEQSRLFVVPSDNSKPTEHAELRSELKSLPVVRTAAAAAAPKSEQHVACSSDSSTSNASSQSAAIAQVESDAVPLCSSSPVDDLVLELQLQHLMGKVPGLAPAMAGFAIQACQGDIEQATFLLQQHMPLLTQLAPASSPPSDAVRLPSAVVQPPLTVDLKRNGQVGHGAALPENSSGKHVLLPAGATSHRVFHQATLVPVSRSKSTSPPSVQRHRVPRQSVHTYSTCSSDREAGFYDASQHIGATGFSTAQLLHGVLLTDDPVAAALDEASKVVEERSRTKSLADQERKALGLHSHARDTYFTAAQVAFEKGNRAAGQELAGRGKEHAHLAKDARQRANQAAYDSCNMSVTNRFKVDLHGLHVEEALQVLEQHLLSLGGLGCPGGILLQVGSMHLPAGMIGFCTRRAAVVTLVPGSFCALAISV